MSSIRVDWERPILIWNKTMVEEMEGLCHRQLRNIDAKRYHADTIERDMQRFSYSQLLTDLRLGRVFVRVFNKEQDTVDIDDENFCGALLNHLFFAWSAPLDRKPVGGDTTFQIGAGAGASAAVPEQDMVNPKP